MMSSLIISTDQFRISQHCSTIRRRKLIQDHIHLVDTQALGLREKAIRPNCRNHQESSKEEPRPIPERVEHIRKAFADRKLGGPLHHGSPGPREIAQCPGKDLGCNNPGHTVEAKGPEDSVYHNHPSGCLASTEVGSGQRPPSIKDGCRVPDLHVCSHIPQAAGTGQG